MSNAAKHLRLILTVKTDGLPSELSTTKFFPTSSDQAIEILQNAGLWYGPRPVLEETPMFRQIIPYIVLRVGDKFIRYTRTPAGGEARLHGLTSIGLGGHTDLSDARVDGESIDLAATLDNAANREVLEELGEVQVLEKHWAGLLVENDSDVGLVHIGMIGVWTLTEVPTSITEDAIGNVESVTLQELEDDVERLEAWSAMLLPWLRPMDVKFCGQISA